MEATDKSEDLLQMGKIAISDQPIFRENRQIWESFRAFHLRETMGISA
jgi:hypothetical protein